MGGGAHRSPGKVLGLGGRLIYRSPGKVLGMGGGGGGLIGVLEEG